MKYVIFTLIDSKSKVSLFKEAGSYGSVIPEGLNPVFSVSSSIGTSTPLFYTQVDDIYDQDITIEVSKEEFLRAFKVEISKELKAKRQLLLDSNFWVAGIEYPNSSYYRDTLAGLLNLESVVVEIKDLEYISLSREEASLIHSVITYNGQSVHRWAVAFLAKLHSAKTPKDLVKLRNALKIVKLEDLV